TKTEEVKIFSNKFEADGITFEEPSAHLFTFNNPIGACKTCGGFGSIIGIDENLVIPDRNLSVFDGAVASWKGEKMSTWKDELVKVAHLFDFPIHRPYCQLSEEEKKVLWTGNKHFQGINDFFKFIESESYKIQYRVMYSRFRGKTKCPECNGTRLRKEAYYVRVSNKNIGEIVSLQIKDALLFFQNIQLDENEKKISKRLLLEITNRLQYLNDVGLGYLTLNRLSNTLSGGESQRINLATSLGSSLVGSMYILDEPSIGLHPRDTQRLIKILKSLRDVGNTVLVVEHDEEIMRAADEIIDLGPGAGTEGGQVVFQGNINTSSLSGEKSNSYTIAYLHGKENIDLPAKRRKWKNYIELKGANENNLKNIDMKIPLNAFTVVTGVSGSGKTSLIKRVLYPAMKADYPGNFSSITGDRHKITAVEMIDQNPIGKSSRSNPVTYIKAYDEIRNLFASQPLAKMRGYKPSTFSFNVDGGRCEVCEGEGEVTIEMQFMADVHLPCDDCKGKRFKDDVLEVMVKGKNIADILDMTVNESVSFFESTEETSNVRALTGKIKLLQDVGMGYIKLGQSSGTLSGGEAQRIKLATFLNTPVKKEGGTLFIFDEPTTGLHFHDIKKLLYALNRLVNEGNTLLVIEHNPDVIKCADWVIDLGPEGGDAGGNLVFEGTPENLVKCPESITGKFLKEKL
ncbi:MAG TPA: excinuclease ABC subunit UvrA, partial [Bacteroidia bacterium]